jgi:hypothetical protein
MNDDQRQSQVPGDVKEGLDAVFWRGQQPMVEEPKVPFMTKVSNVVSSIPMPELSRGQTIACGVVAGVVAFSAIGMTVGASKDSPNVKVAEKTNGPLSQPAPMDGPTKGIVRFCNPEHKEGGLFGIGAFGGVDMYDVEQCNLSKAALADKLKPGAYVSSSGAVALAGVNALTDASAKGGV